MRSVPWEINKNSGCAKGIISEVFHIHTRKPIEIKQETKELHCKL